VVKDAHKGLDYTTPITCSLGPRARLCPSCARQDAHKGLGYPLLVPQNGGRYFDDNFNPVLDTDEKTIEACMLQEKMYKAEVLYMTSSWNPGWYQAMNEGKFAAMLYGNWWDEFLKQNLPDMSGKWGIMDVPAFANGVHKVPMAAVPF
jgi:hypothetical protein